MASLRRGHSDNKDAVRYSDSWVVGTVTRKLHGCMIVNHDVFIHKSAYTGVFDTNGWFACLRENDAVEFIAKEHIESKNRWRGLLVRDPPVAYRRARSSPPEPCAVYGPPPTMLTPQFYGPSGPPMMMMSPPPPTFYMPHPMFVQTVPVPFPQQGEGAFLVPPPSFHHLCPSPASPLPPIPAHNLSPTTDSALYPSPPATHLSPQQQPTPTTTAATPSNASTNKPSASPTMIRYVPDKGDMKNNTPHDVTHDEDDDVSSNASLSSHSTNHGATTAARPEEGAEMKDSDIQLFHQFLSSGDVRIAEQALANANEKPDSFITTVLSLTLNPMHASGKNIVKVKQMFLHIFTEGLFDSAHFQVAWIVAMRRLAHGHTIDKEAAVELLSDGINHGYISVDGLRFIVAPLKTTHHALPIVAAAFAKLLQSRDRDFLLELYHTSSLKFGDFDGSMTEEQVASCLKTHNLDFLLAPLKPIDVLNFQVGALTISN